MDGLNSLGWTMHDHLKSARPKMFQALQQEGRLNQYLLDQQTSLSEQLTNLEHSGLQPHEAREMLRDQIYLPTEEDLPDLGGTRQPYTD